jgi:hypothetical protein
MIIKCYIELILNGHRPENPILQGNRRRIKTKQILDRHSTAEIRQQLKTRTCRSGKEKMYCD